MSEKSIVFSPEEALQYYKRWQQVFGGPGPNPIPRCGLLISWDDINNAGDFHSDFADEIPLVSPSADKSLKEERERQWGQTGDGSMERGWDRWRSSTFLEMVSAKIDRALQVQNLLQQHRAIPENERPTTSVYDEIEKGLIVDGLDSLKYAKNYLRKLMELVEKNERYYTRNEMP